MVDISTASKILDAANIVKDSVIVSGKHGIGKSAIMKQFAKKNNYFLTELFLSNQEVGDLIGIPETVVHENNVTVTTWTIPIWLQRMNEAAKNGQQCILFLDELNRAPLDVRQSALQLVLEGKIHEHKLPIVNGQRTFVTAAINPADEYQVDELDPALLDRFLFVDVETDAPAWLNWARDNNVNTIVRDFIAEYPDRLHWTPADGGIGASQRSWTKLAEYMDNNKKIPNEVLFQIMKGKIGKEIASQFYTFFKNYVDVVKAADIEKIVEDNKDKCENIEDISVIIAEKIKKSEAITKSELAQQIKDNCSKKNNMLVLLAYLYALEIEICVAFLKGFKKDNMSDYSKLAKLDDELNKKELFKRIVKAAEKQD